MNAFLLEIVNSSNSYLINSIITNKTDTQKTKKKKDPLANPCWI